MENTNCNQVISHIMTCKTCYEYMMKHQRSVAGSHTSERKAKASRENGFKGGRPRKVK